MKPEDAIPVLCSPGLGLSCFACCPPIRPPGYDHVDYRSSLRRLLAENTAEIRSGRLPEKPMTGFWCPGLGFLDRAGRRAGCLLHPRVNGGRDLREATGYREKCARETCAAFRAHAALEGEIRLILLERCRGLDAFDFGSPARNPVMALLNLGPDTARAAARLGVRREEMAGWGWIFRLDHRLGWLAGRVWERLGEGFPLPEGPEDIIRGLLPELIKERVGRPPAAGDRPWGDLAGEWEARFWRLILDRHRGRPDELERLRERLGRLLDDLPRGR